MTTLRNKASLWVVLMALCVGCGNSAPVEPPLPLPDASKDSTPADIAPADVPTVPDVSVVPDVPVMDVSVVDVVVPPVDVAVDVAAPDTPVSDVAGPDACTGELCGTQRPRRGGELVGAGAVSRSARFRMISTFGQPTQNQVPMASARNRLRGGFIGATGGSP